MEEGTRYICKPKGENATFFTVQVVLPPHEEQLAKYRVLNEHGMVCYVTESGDSEVPFICVLGLKGDGYHPSEILATPESAGLL